MTTPIIMPRLGLTRDEGTVVAWLVSEGQQVTQGDPLPQVETDKVTVAVEAPASGIVGLIPPQWGMLTLGRIAGPAQKATLSLACDRSVVDATTALHFLDTLVACLEQSARDSKSLAQAEKPPLLPGSAGQRLRLSPRTSG